MKHVLNVYVKKLGGMGGTVEFKDKVDGLSCCRENGPCFILATLH